MSVTVNVLIHFLFGIESESKQLVITDMLYYRYRILWLRR